VRAVVAVWDEAGRGRRSRLWQRAGLHALLIATSAVFVVPLLWMLYSSLKSNGEIFLFPPRLIPNPPIWSNDPNATIYILFWRYTWNAFVISGASVIGTLFACPIAAYAFARLRWRLRGFFFALSLTTIMLWLSSSCWCSASSSVASP
jgi:multiple sugar transport system permease protein